MDDMGSWTRTQRRVQRLAAMSGHDLDTESLLLYDLRDLQALELQLAQSTMAPGAASTRPWHLVAAGRLQRSVGRAARRLVDGGHAAQRLLADEERGSGR